MHCLNKHTLGGEWDNICIAKQLCLCFFRAETYNCTILKLLCVDKGEREREKEREVERRGEREERDREKRETEREREKRREEGETDFERERESELIDK